MSFPSEDTASRKDSRGDTTRSTPPEKFLEVKAPISPHEHASALGSHPPAAAVAPTAVSLQRAVSPSADFAAARALAKGRNTNLGHNITSFSTDASVYSTNESAAPLSVATPHTAQPAAKAMQPAMTDYHFSDAHSTRAPRPTFRHDDLASRVASAKRLLQAAAQPAAGAIASTAADSASLQAFKALLAETLAARKPCLAVPAALGTVELLDESVREAAPRSAAAGTGAAAPAPKQEGSPMLPSQCSPMLLTHLERMGVALHERWSALHVQAACWGVPLWVLRSAQDTLQADGLPPTTDAVHWVIRLWPVASTLQAAGDSSAEGLFDALLQPHAEHAPAPLAQLWEMRKDGAEAVIEHLADSVGTTVLPPAVFAQLLCAVPDGVRCPEVPPPWPSHTTAAQRQQAWGWLKAHFATAAAHPPPSLLSAQRSPVPAPALGAQEALLLAAVWHPALPEDALIATARKTPVRKSDLQRLKPSSWLNDELINCRLGLFAAAAEAAPARAYVPNLYFLSSLGTGAEYNYNAVRRWTKRAKVDVAQLDRAVFPINTANMHWTAAVVDFHQQQCVHWDSLSGGVAGQHGEELRSLRRWLADELRDKHGMERGAAIQQWPVTAAPRSAVPQQSNGIDCGVFCVQFCVGLLCGAEEMLAQCCRSEHVAYLRLWFALAFLARGPHKTEPRTGPWEQYLRDTIPADHDPPHHQAAIFTAGASSPAAAAASAGPAAVEDTAEECLVLSD